MTTGAAITIRSLTKDFELGLVGTRLRAIDGLSLSIETGQIFGLLGPNGSGKSTTIKIVLDLLSATAGECRVFGVPSSRVEARREIGYLPEAPYFHRYLTGRELVNFYGGLCGLSGSRLKTRVREVIAWAGLAESGDRRVGTYSKGMLQRIGLAQALVHEPRLLILDEPTAGMDPAGAAEVMALILRLKVEGKTVVIVSHLLAQIEAICDRVAILDHGRLIWEGAPTDFTGASERQALMVDPLTPDQLVELREWLEVRGRSLLGVGRPRARMEEAYLRHAATPQSWKR